MNKKIFVVGCLDYQEKKKIPSPIKYQELFKEYEDLDITFEYLNLKKKQRKN